MISNGNCTVIRRSGESLETVYSGLCMWQEIKSSDNKSSYGESSKNTANVWIPDVNADIQKGDYIFRTVPETLDSAALYNAMHIHKIDRNDFGSKQMQHLMLEVTV